jgi:hypothetical protein
LVQVADYLQLKIIVVSVEKLVGKRFESRAGSYSLSLIRPTWLNDELSMVENKPSKINIKTLFILLPEREGKGVSPYQSYGSDALRMRVLSIFPLFIMLY